MIITEKFSYHDLDLSLISKEIKKQIVLKSIDVYFEKRTEMYFIFFKKRNGESIAITKTMDDFVKYLYDSKKHFDNVVVEDVYSFISHSIKL